MKRRIGITAESAERRTRRTQREERENYREHLSSLPLRSPRDLCALRGKILLRTIGSRELQGD
jgi:hypothetical protein